MPKRIDPAVRERALRMFAEHRQDYPSDTTLALGAGWFEPPRYRHVRPVTTD